MWSDRAYNAPGTQGRARGTIVASSVLATMMFRAIALVLVGLLPSACSPDSARQPDDGIDGGDPEAVDAGADGGVQDHHLMPDVAHSGYDGSSTFKVPVYTTMEEAVFAMDDEAVASIEPVELPPELEDLGTFGKSWAMITTAQSGSSAFSAEAGGLRLEAQLIVAAYDPADVAVGDGRYNDPASPNETDRIACQECHGGPDGVDHTPLALAYFSDAEVLEMVANGLYPEGTEVNEGNHHWNLTEAEAAGIVPYLRSLQPQGF
jgi:hypothetical protein